MLVSQNGDNKGISQVGELGGEEFSFGGGANGGVKDKDEKKEEKEGLTGLHAKAAEVQDSGVAKYMPPASVMTCLILIMVWRKLIRNPNTYSSLIGLILSLFSYRWHVHMPKIMEKSISILSDAGLGMAMFSLGLFMALQPKIIACGNTVAVFAMAVRFLAGPAVMAASSIIVGLRGTLLHVAIVQNIDFPRIDQIIRCSFHSQGHPAAAIEPVPESCVSTVEERTMEEREKW